MTSMSNPDAPSGERLSPGLYIVATPIGNLGDLSPRAADTLARADWVACEDSRVTATLTRHIGARVRFLRYHDHSGEAERAAILDRLADESVALVSDAGTPLIADPGFKLVRAARAAGHRVVTVPGPSALTAALTLAGLPTDRVVFEGFLPAKAGARTTALERLADWPATLVFYESGPRLGASLATMAEVLGEGREAAVARELTKRHEECVTGTLAELAVRYADAPPKGEIVVVVGSPLAAQPPAADELDERLAELLRTLRPSDAAGQLARETGADRRALYARAVALKG